VIQTRPPADRFSSYAIRITTGSMPPAGSFPYIDRVILNIADGRILAAQNGRRRERPASTRTNFRQLHVPASGGETNDFNVHLWNTAKGAQIALYTLNLNAADPIWRALNRDVRFRRALSLAINRHEINQAVYSVWRSKATTPS